MDATSKFYTFKDSKYKCKNIGKLFNVKTNTIFDNTKMPLQKCFIAIWLITSHKEYTSKKFDELLAYSKKHNLIIYRFFYRGWLYVY